MKEWSSREMRSLLTIQHNYVTPHWRRPLNIFIREDPERLFQSILDEPFARKTSRHQRSFNGAWDWAMPPADSKSSKS